MHFHRFDEPGKVKLDKISEEPPPKVTKQEARDRLEKLGEELFELQDWMWGARTHSVLMDRRLGKLRFIDTTHFEDIDQPPLIRLE